MQSPVQAYLEAMAATGRDTPGEVAQYIPELAAADPDRFALALATVDGHTYHVGDCQDPFSIQSISKPFTYALAIHDQGLAAVDAKVGVEPSGDAFNEISVSSETGRPLNPMINAGAITAASLVAGATPEERFQRVLGWYSEFADRELQVDEEIFASELRTAHRNRAIAHMLREFEVLTGDPEATLWQYIRQCSISVTSADLAAMATTLANGGIQPRTGRRVLSAPTVERVLSVMATCGMYDAAGDWVSNVGMPAKSGVSGGIIAVLPGQVGLAVLSPRLDAHGNSARGVMLFEQMSHDMELHLMHVGRTARTAVRASYSLLSISSRRRRTEPEQEILAAYGDRVRIYELHGDLLFGSAESVVRAVVEDEPELAILDLRRVDDVTGVAGLMLTGLRNAIRKAGGEGVMVDPSGVVPTPDADSDHATRVFADLDSAVLWCESQLLRRHGDGLELDPTSLVAEHPLLKDLSSQARALVKGEMKRVQVPQGETALAAGGRFAGVHIILSGIAVATVEGADGESLPLVTLHPGASFGELALGTSGIQESKVTAARDLDLLVLPAAAIDEITRSDPAVGLEVWQAMTRDGYRVADRALRAGLSRG